MESSTVFLFFFWPCPDLSPGGWPPPLHRGLFAPFRHHLWFPTIRPSSFPITIRAQLFRPVSVNSRNLISGFRSTPFTAKRCLSLLLRPGSPFSFWMGPVRRFPSSAIKSILPSFFLPNDLGKFPRCPGFAPPREGWRQRIPFIPTRVSICASNHEIVSLLDPFSERVGEDFFSLLPRLTLLFLILCLLV